MLRSQPQQVSRQNEAWVNPTTRQPDKGGGRGGGAAAAGGGFANTAVAIDGDRTRRDSEHGICRHNFDPKWSFGDYICLPRGAALSA